MSNADNLTEAFAAADKGDASLLVDLYADDMTWAGFKADGTQTVYTKASFLEGFGILAHLDEARNEVVRTEETPEGLVIAWIRAYRRKGDDVLDFTLVMVHQFVDGKVTRGADVAPPSFGEYWTRLGLA
ncbi:nuclear transport factor 2 family protein [Pseudonocardia halophobica]|uniref:nuclear transport factor 2 family protein n=1 Tax=Pseudonocardia halophobica TaxID=29401 RepID=UPI003D94608A